jgi:hypothetical protein
MGAGRWADAIRPGQAVACGAERITGAPGVGWLMGG